MTGIGDYGDTTPNIFTGPGDVDQEETTTTTPATSPTELDALLEGELLDPEFLQLRVTRALNLPPGSVSLLELTAIISAVISQLREALNESEIIDAEIARQYHLSAAQTAQDVLDQYSIVGGQVDAWSGELYGVGIEIEQRYALLVQARENFNNLLVTTAANDSAAIQDVNQYIDIYNDPDAFAAFANANFGGDQNAALAFINQKIGQYNSYMASRPNMQAALNDYVNATQQYNAVVNDANNRLQNINSERVALGLPPLPLVDGTPVPNGNINSYLPHEGQMPNSLPTVSLPAGSTNINRINVNPSVSNVLPAPVDPGEFPRNSYAEAFALLWLPDALGTLSFLASFNRILDLAEALRDIESMLYFELGYNIITPSALLERAQQIYLDAIGTLGGGIGLAAFAMGLHTRNLEIALSRAILSSIAMNSRFPITGRLFSTLQFTALELLQRSALLSPLPALRYIASAVGHLGSASPAVRVAISLAITTQVAGLIGGGVLRELVNSQFNRVPFYARVRHNAALSNVVYAERNLQNAIASGHPGRIRDAIAMLGNARLQLARTTVLMNTIGLASIGGLASFTRAVSATMSLSMLSVAMAHFGRAIGLPGIVAQLFAHVSGVPTLDLLVAMTAGSRILDVLDNPFSVLALKQTLVDHLVYNRGFNSVVAGLMVNSAINNIILRGGIYSNSHLRSELVGEFQRSGFSYFHAHQLANETIALINGDIGINFLSAAYGLNYDRSIIASSIVNHITGIDIGIAGAMLTNAVTRSLMYGGYGSRVRLQNELTAQFQNLGLSYNDAYGMASTMVNFIETVGVAIPLSQYPGLASVLMGDTLLSAVAFGSNIARNELIYDLRARGLTPFQAEFLADQVISLAARTFATPGNLFALALEAAIERSGTSFETQRDFRDRVFNELKAVGFSTVDAMFLANSVASYALDASLISIFGVTPTELAAIEGVAVSRLSNELGVSGSQAQVILNEALGNALASGPYSSPDQFRNALREEFFSAVLNHTGRSDGHQIFDRAIAELTDPGTILSLAALAEQISTSVLGILRPDLGARIAQEVKDQILIAILGGTNVDEIEDTEHRNPLSVLHQIEDSIRELQRSEEEEEMRAMLRKLIQLLQALLTPNAEVGFLLQSLSDSPDTFIGSVLGSEQPTGQFDAMHLGPG